MAEYVTLKKPDGTVIYPQSVIAQVADGSIQSSQIDWSTINLYNYSTTEAAIGSWIDGRTIYRKVLTGTTANTAISNITHGISGLAGIIKAYGYLTNSNGIIEPIQRVVPDNITTYGIGLGDFDSTSFQFQHSSSLYHGRPFAIVLEYIKTS